ncbi:MAG: excinuclease ABC subunit UvrA [Pseudomonadota bacterium]|nr:excinuclease ABC subunit UvrA [Pseudomonadota bacterium]
MRSSLDFVRVRGAREHNLKNVDVDVPRDALVVFTGISGSGKSSLAFGTIYAEAQRRYFESVAPYARRLIEQVGAPDVDSIEGLPPAVALQQQRGSPTARSSVGSVTTISSLVRLLYSRAGSYPPKQPMLYAEDFSPNTPAGACPECHGLGRVYQVTERSLVPDDRLTIRERAVAAWPPAWHGQNLRDILTTLGHDVDVPWRELPKKTRDWILFTDEQPTVPVYAGFSLAEARAARRQKMDPSYMGTFTSARRYVLQAFATTQSAIVKKRVSAYLIGSVCPMCDGKRLKRAALSIRFAGRDIGELARLSLAELGAVLRPAAEGRLGDQGGAATTSTLSRVAAERDTQRRVAGGGSAHAGAPDVRRTPNLSEEKRIAAQRLATEIVGRVATLEGLGLGYLSLERSTPTLSPGELQRLRLATQLGSQLFGVVYVLDEPSAGLHPADAEALLDALQRLKAAGNSLFVVEHDLEVMRRADWLVDVGPAAGQDGGRVLYSGAPAGLADVAASVTRRYLFGTGGEAGEAGPTPTGNASASASASAGASATASATASAGASAGAGAGATADLSPRPRRDWLRLDAVTRNNLHDIAVAFPLGCLTAVTGVSGSGKSSLASQALLDLVSHALGATLPASDDDGPDDDADASTHVAEPPEHVASGRIAAGMERVARLVCVDQKPIGRTPRSNLATYTGLFDPVRRLFAATPAAKRRHYDAGRFSFNVAKGRCPTCEGEGFVSVELLFLPSVYAPCPACHGARYNAETLAVTWQDKSIAEVLAMTVDAAAAFFAGQPSIARPLQVLQQIGLGYLRLGQPATELSGGEAQRIKLATELQRQQRGNTLYVLDEPTTGLHPADVDKLVAQLQQLVDAGNSVVVVEHDMRVVAACDWVIDMGPGAGDAGGRIVSVGTPTEVAAAPGKTAPYLARELHARSSVPRKASPRAR